METTAGTNLKLIDKFDEVLSGDHVQNTLLLS